MRLWAISAWSEFKWLPVAGGIYDQHPKLLEEWAILFQLKNEKEAREAAEAKRRAEKGRR